MHFTVVGVGLLYSMRLDLDVGKKKGVQQVAHHGLLHYGKDETSRDFLPAVKIKSVVLWSHSISLVHVSSTLRPLRLSGSHLCELVADDFSDEISDFGQHWDPNLGKMFLNLQWQQLYVTYGNEGHFWMLFQPHLLTLKVVRALSKSSSSSWSVGCRAGDYELPPATTILCQFRQLARANHVVCVS